MIATAAGVTAVSGLLSVLSGIGTAIGAGIGARKREKEAKKQARRDAQVAVNKLNQLLNQNKIDFGTWTDRFNTLMQSQESGIRSTMQNALSSGLQNIADQQTAMLDKIDFEIGEARQSAGREEDKLLKRVQDRFKELKTETRVNNREIRNAFTQRGLNGGALSAALTRNQQNLNEATIKLDELAGEQISDIKDRLGGMERSGIFQRGQTGLQAMINARQLRTDIATNETNALSSLAMQGFNTQTAKEDAFKGNQQEIISQGIALGENGKKIDIAGAF